MRIRHGKEWWEQELEFINSVSCDNPGVEFSGSPYVFSDYCWMQAKFACEDGFIDIANEMDRIGRRARNVNPLAVVLRSAVE